MNSNEQEEFRKIVLSEIKSQKDQIESLLNSVKPVAPDNAIGRLTRMEAIESKGVSEASLNSSRIKLAKLEAVLDRIKNPDFGICIRCSIRIPKERMIFVPESVTCVVCAEGKKGSIGRP